MRISNHLRSSLFFVFIFIFLVQANSEDLSLQTIDETLNEVNSTSQAIATQQEASLLTGDVIAEANYTANVLDQEQPPVEERKEPLPDTPVVIEEPIEKEDEPIEQDIPLDEEKQPDEQEEPLIGEEDNLFAGLQPQLPGPKPGGTPEGGSATEKGEHWERSCDETTCTATLYPYQKYYPKDGQWQQIDENFYSTPCISGYGFCVTDNLYQVHMKAYADSSNAFFLQKDDLSFSFRPHTLSFTAPQQQQSFAIIRQSPAQVANNRVRYPAAFGGGIDLAFRYLPRLFKEEMTITSKELLPALNFSAPLEDVSVGVDFILDVPAPTALKVDGQPWDQQTSLVTHQPVEITNGKTSFYLVPPFASDARGYSQRGNYSLAKKDGLLHVTINVPYLWFINTSRRYPVLIDPTITLDNNSILFDGYVTECNGGPNPACATPTSYVRDGLSTTTKVGDEDIGGPLNDKHRADIDWDITVIPDLAQIENIQLNLSFTSVDASNDEMRFYPMVGGNSHYPDDDTGNMHFYNDAGNGTEYLRQQATASALNTFNLTNHSQLKTDFETFLVNGTDSWSIGIRSEEPGTAGAIPSLFTTSEGTPAANRPTLDVTYKPFASETEGDAAIVQGIQNVFTGGSGSHEDDQQVYVYNSSGGHQLGIFDAVALNASKRWLIGYITSGENFLNLENMSTAVYNVELQNLTALQITTQVEAFIRGTV